MDLIDRQAAIDAIYTSTSDGDRAEWFAYVVRQVPSAEKRGTWVIHFKDGEPYGTQCSCCGFVWSEEIVAVKLSPIFSRIYTPYCPNCGAKMESEE